MEMQRAKDSQCNIGGAKRREKSREHFHYHLGRFITKPQSSDIMVISAKVVNRSVELEHSERVPAGAVI